MRALSKATMETVVRETLKSPSHHVYDDRDPRGISHHHEVHQRHVAEGGTEYGKDDEKSISDYLREMVSLGANMFAVYCSHQMSPNKALHCVMRTGQGRIEYNPDIVAQLDHQREHHRDHASAETQRHGNTICP